MEARTISEMTNEIETIKARIETRRNDPHYFEKTPILDMHDNGNSDYESDLGMIHYYEVKIEREKAREAEEAETERRTALMAEKLGMTVEAYKTQMEAKKEAKAQKAKAKRYREELAELEARKAYLEKWLKEYEAK